MVPRPSSFLHKFFWLMLLCGVFAVDALAQIGTIQFVAGDVRIRNAVGVERPAQKGGTLAEGDTIIAGSGASAQLKMVDNGIIAVRSDSELKFDQYAFKGQADGSERAFLSLLKGGFRTVTGLIGRTNRQNYRVTTATATIGIRGTDFEPYFVTQEIPGGNPAAAAPTRLAQATLPVEIAVDIQEPPTLIAAAQPPAGAPAIPIRSTLAAVYSGRIGMSPPALPARVLEVGANQAGLVRPDATVAIIPRAVFDRVVPSPGKPVAGKPVADKPAADKPAVAEKPAAEKPAVAAAPAEKPAAAPPPAEKVAATPAPGVAAEPSPVSDVRSTAVVDTTPPPPTPPAPTVTVAPAPAPSPVATVTVEREVKATAPNVVGTANLDLTRQDVTVAVGTTTFKQDLKTNTITATDATTGTTSTFSAPPASTGGGTTAIGDFGILARSKSTSAQTSLTNATSAVDAIPLLQKTATGNNTTLQAVAPVITTQTTSLVNAIVSVQQSSPSLVDGVKLTTAQTQLSAANTEIAKISPAQTTASTALTTLTSQLPIAQTALGSGTTAPDPNPTQVASTVASGCGSVKACADLAADYAAAATTQQTAQNFTLAQNAFNNASEAASRAATFEKTATDALATAQTAEATIAAQKTIATNANTAAGTAVTASLAAAQLAVSDLGLLATAQSAAAQASLTNATSAVNAIPSLQTTATANNTAVQAVAPASMVQATSLVNTIVSVQQSTPSLVDSAQLTTAQTQLSTATTENAKITAAQSAASAAFTTLTSQLAIAQAAMGSGATTLDSNPTQAASTFAAGCGSAKACADLAAQYAAAAQTAQTAQNFTTALNALSNASTAASRAATFEQTANTARAAAQAADATILAQKTIATNANTAAGTAVSASLAAAQLAVGDFGILAQSSANAALAAKNSINTISTALGTAATTTAQNLFNAASAANTAAQADATIIAGIAAVNTATAASNLASITTVATTAAGQASTARNVNTANNVAGVADFRDSQAAPALAAMNTADTAVQGALTTATSANTSATTQSGLLTTAKSSAVTQASAATTAFNAAQMNFTALTTAAVVDAGTTNANQTVSNMLSLATAAASAAQAAATSAATKQSTGDLIGAQADLAFAQSQNTKAQSFLALAQQIQLIGGVGAAQAALAQLKTDATSAKSAGDAAVAATSSALSTANTNATTVAANFLRAQYNNPAVASTNFSHEVLSQKLITGGAEFADISTSLNRPRTNYVLNENKDVVEIRNTEYDRFGFATVGVVIPDANVKFSGGVAKDHFQDANSTFYMGRWQGGQIDVTDLATINPVPPFSQLLGPTSAHWIIGLLPGNSPFSTSLGPTLGPINNVQRLVGSANYSLTAATHPTDSFGNVGTLNSASVTANFTSQTVNTALNLSFSSTDPVNISSRNLSIAASANNVPIDKTGFEASFLGAGFGTATVFGTGAGAGTVTCTGPNCAPPSPGYFGAVGSVFGAAASGGTTTGAVGTGLGLAYFFAPLPSSPTQSVPEDLIQGAAVLTTGVAPSPGVINNFPDNTRVRHEAFYSTSAVGSTDTFTVRARDTIDITTPTPATLSGPRVNTNYLFDASGNLVRIFDTPYVIFDAGKDLATTTQFAAPTPLAHAQVSFGGGSSAPFDLFNFTPTGGTDPIIRMGRWQGGFVHLMDLQPPQGFVVPGFIDSLVSPIGGGSRSVHWLVRQGVPIIPTTGAFHYVRIPDAAGNNSFATAPTDSYGNVGTLERARLTADFTRMTVSAGLAVTMPSGAGGLLGIQNLSGNFADAPLQGGGFSVSSSPANNPPNTDRFNISCFGPGCAPNQTYGGRVRGAFAGLNAEGAFYRYTFHTNYGPTNPAPAGRVNDDYIDGMVAFGKGPQIVTPPLTHPGGPSEVLTAYTFSDGTFTQPRTNNFSVEKPDFRPNPSNLTLDGLGNLLSVFEPAEAGEDHNHSLTLTGGTAAPASPIPAGNGITLGGRSPSPTLTLTVSGEDFNGCFGTTGCTTPARTVLGAGLAWVRGPAVFPWYLPGAIANISGGTVVTGSATFNLTGSIVRDGNGLGATGPVSANLVADFNRAAVGFSMTIPTAAGTWAAFNNVTLGGAIIPDVRMEMEGSFHAFTSTETTTPSGINTHRRMTVTLNGSPGSGNVQGQLMGPGVNGAGMTYTFFSGSTPRVLGALAFNNNNPTPFSAETPYHLVGAASGMNSLGQFDEEENTPIRGGVVSRSRTDFVNGLPVRVDLEFPVRVIPPAGCTTCTQVTEIPAVYAVTGATGVASIGNAQIFDSGRDPTTGIRWGRYGGPGSAAGAFIGVTDRISGVAIPTAALPDVGPNTQGVHFIATGTQSGPTVLPISGTFNYTRVGNTNPTDNFGSVGVLNSAALSADFTNQRVSASVNLTIPVGGATWTASTPVLNGTATGGVPIQRGTFFEAAKNLDGPGNLAVTTTRITSSDNRVAGRLVGAFTGQTGVGAGVLYSLNQGGNTATNPSATTVSGVAAFKR